MFGLLKHGESMGLHSRSDETLFTFCIFCSKYILTVVVTAWHFSLLKSLVYSTIIYNYLQGQLIFKKSHLAQML